MRPVTGTYPAYFDNYIKLVDAASPEEAIEKYGDTLVKFFKKLSEEDAGYRYAPGKWSIRELLQHVIDTERIFAYRILCIARGEQQPLPGFDENAYAQNSNADQRSWKSLLKEWKSVRKSTDLLIRSLHNDQLQSAGTTNGQPNTVVAICFTVIGHALHHIQVIKERYLQET